MTKKDYERAAEIVQGMRDGIAHTGTSAHAVDCNRIDGAEYAFVALFACDNPRFDKTRFRAACVPGANVKARPRKVRRDA
jgi:hypothetical protein